MELADFLVEAKSNTYASNGEGGERKLADGSRELEYAAGEWKYRDQYFGFNPFIGEEIIWKDGAIFWGMNYYGKAIAENIDAKQLYAFLKKALQQVRADRPFRGPAEFVEDDWRYHNESQGAIDSFAGLESIYLGNKQVYELKYNGGSIEPHPA